MRKGARQSFVTVLLGGVAIAAWMVQGTHAQQGAEVTPDVTKELAAVRAVLGTEPMARALKYIDDTHDETVREFLQICSTPGPSQDESYRARAIYRLMSIYGLSNVHIDDENNVIGIRKGTGGGPTVVINAHHDNVQIWPKEQPIAAFVADGRVWCPAARDDQVGVVQALLALRAMNAGNIQTKGDVWFVTLSGEEPFRNKRSPGSEYFVRSNYPHNLDWRKGDIMVQLHGGGGEGISTGSVNLRHSAQLRVFMPVNREQWAWHAMDVLGKVMARVTSEVRPSAQQQNTGRGDDFMVINMSNPEPTNHPMNESVQGASIRFNFQIQTERRVNQAHEQIQRIAREVCAEMGEGCTYHYTVNTRNGTEQGITGFDNVNNAPARFAAAAAKALYNTSGVIAPRSGCGDCVRAYQNGMPAFSVRGNVLDLGGGNFKVGNAPRLDPNGVRRATETHDITDSIAIDEIWAGSKHIMLFAVSYTGQAPATGQSNQP